MKKRKQRRRKHRPDFEKKMHVQSESHRLAALAEQAAPRYPEVRDAFSVLILDAETWKVNFVTLREVVNDVMSEFIPADVWGITSARERHVINVMKMHWGEEFHSAITSDVRDTNLSAMLLPKGVKSPEHLHGIYSECIASNDGTHPLHGNLLLWSLSTLAKSHPIREDCEHQKSWGETLVPMSTVMHALTVIMQRLIKEQPRKHWNLTMYSNRAELAYDMSTMLVEG